LVENYDNNWGDEQFQNNFTTASPASKKTQRENGYVMLICFLKTKK